MYLQKHTFLPWHFIGTTSKQRFLHDFSTLKVKALKQNRLIK